MKKRMAQKTSIIFKNDLKIRNFVTFLFLFLKIFGYYEYHGTLYFSPTRIHAAIKNSFTYG
jgi:hypothetical protein